MKSSTLVHFAKVAVETAAEATGYTIVDNNVHKSRSDLIYQMNREVAALRGKVADLEVKLEASKEVARHGEALTQRQLKNVQQQYVDACRAIAGAIYGPDRDPFYEGDGIAPGWIPIARDAIEKLRHQNIGLKAALLPFLPYFDQILRNRQKDDDILFVVDVKGSMHQSAVRRRDVRILRELVEQIR